jgi:hypothetical protein
MSDKGKHMTGAHKVMRLSFRLNQCLHRSSSSRCGDALGSNILVVYINCEWGLKGRVVIQYLKWKTQAIGYLGWNADADEPSGFTHQEGYHLWRDLLCRQNEVPLILTIGAIHNENRLSISDVSQNVGKSIED